jgi:hypothetical protein
VGTPCACAPTRRAAYPLVEYGKQHLLFVRFHVIQKTVNAQIVVN